MAHRGHGRVSLGGPPGSQHRDVAPGRGASRRLPHDQAAHHGLQVLPLSLRSGALGLCRRALGRRRGAQDLLCRRAPQHRVRLRALHRDGAGHAVQGLGRGHPPRVSPRSGRADGPRLRRGQGACTRSRRGHHQPRPDGQPGRLAGRVSLRAGSVLDRSLRRGRSHRQGAEAPHQLRHRRPLRRAALHRFGGLLVAGRPALRLRGLRRRQQRDHRGGCRLGQVPPAHPRAGCGRDRHPGVVPGRQLDRVLRHRGRDQRSLPRRSQDRGHAKDHRGPRRRTLAGMVAGRPHARVRDRSRPGHRLREADLREDAHRPHGHGQRGDPDPGPVPRGQAHRPAVLPRRPEPLLHLRPRRLQRHLPHEPLRRRDPPSHQARHRGERDQRPVAGHLGVARDRPHPVLGVRQGRVQRVRPRRRGRAGRAARRGRLPPRAGSRSTSGPRSILWPRR